MPLQALKNKFNSGVAAAALTLSASLPFAGAAHADIHYITAKPLNEVTVQAAAKRYEEKDVNMAIIHKGKPMAPNVESILTGTLGLIEKENPDINITVVEGGDYEGIKLFIPNNTPEEYSPFLIEQLVLYNTLVRKMAEKQEIVQVSHNEQSLEIASLD